MRLEELVGELVVYAELLEEQAHRRFREGHFVPATEDVHSAQLLHDAADLLERYESTVLLDQEEMD